MVRLAPALRLPSVVVEIVAGIVLGAAVLGWIEVDLPVEILSLLGLAFLLFLGGTEIDLARVKGGAVRGAAIGFVGTLANRLLSLAAMKRPVSAHQFHVAGTLRDPYHRADIHLFSDADPTLAIARQEGGTVLVSSQQRHPDLGRYFTTWRVLEHRHWNPAFHPVGDTLLECEQGPGVYLVGDHNIVGLEDAYLTGLHAANRIIHASALPCLASHERIRNVHTAAAPNPGALTQ